MSKEKTETPVKEDAPEDTKMADPEMEKKAEKKVEEKAEKKKKGRLICRLEVRGEDVLYKAGAEYKGKRAKYLLSRGAIYQE